jgi:hypothetical protein
MQVSYSWSDNCGGTFTYDKTDTLKQNPIWTAPSTPTDKCTITLTVSATDNNKISKTISFDVKVTSNNPPVINTISANPSMVEPGGKVNLYSYASDPDGDQITSYSWTDNCGGKFDNPNAQNPIWTAPSTPTDKCTITLTVSDGEASDTKTVDVSVNEKTSNTNIKIQKK